MIHRDIEHVVVKSLPLREITILVGARQVGKTTVLKKIADSLQKQGKNVIFLNFDIESNAVSMASQQALINKARLEFGNEPGYIFIDEIQQKEDAGRFLKGLFDAELPYKMIVTGSGSLELKEKISESLAGRKRLIEMTSVSFKEFIDYKTGYKYSNRLDQYCETEKENLDFLLTEYLSFGGYPKIVTAITASEKREIMNEIFSSYITKDITYLLKVRTPDRFVKLIKLLAVQNGKLLNYSKLSTETGISVETLKEYLWYIEQTFVTKTISPYFTNPKKEITKSPIVYFKDLGMCNFATGKFGITDASGFVFQNFIYLLLTEKLKGEFYQINYWRTKDKAEVDFIIHLNGNVIPLEVKFSNLKGTTISRAFRSFIEKYKPHSGYVVNLSLDETIKINGTTVRFIPYWKLMFNEEFPMRT
jgi:predicted AAA+ superfamily ATPase